MVSQRMDEIIGDLTENPLFHLSLSSKELFHTNFWMWLGELQPKLTADALFPGVKVKNPKFKREYSVKGVNPENPEEKVKALVDLALVDGDELVAVIENKVKDFFTSNQQWRIWCGISKTQANKHRFLYSLFDPGNPQFLEHWNKKSYLDLASQLETKLLDELKEFDKEITRKYIELCKSLHELSRYIRVEENYDLVGPEANELFKMLDKVRMREAWLKFKGAHLVSYISGDLEKELPGFHIRTASNTFHKKPTLDFFLEFENGSEAGIQIEGNQYRRVVATPNDNAMNAAVLLMGKRIWLTEENGYKLNYMARKSRGKEDFAGYKLNFRYIWKEMEPGISYSNLCKIIGDDLKFIISHEGTFNEVLGSGLKQKSFD